MPPTRPSVMATLGGGVEDTEGEAPALRLPDADAVLLRVPVLVPLGDALTETDADAAEEGDALLLPLTVAVAEPLTVASLRDAPTVMDAEVDADAEAVPVHDGQATYEAEGELLPVPAVRVAVIEVDTSKSNSVGSEVKDAEEVKEAEAESELLALLVLLMVAVIDGVMELLLGGTAWRWRGSVTPSTLDSVLLFTSTADCSSVRKASLIPAPAPRACT